MIKNYAIMVLIVIISLIPIIFIAQISSEDEFADFEPTGTVNDIQEAHDIILDIMSVDAQTDSISNILNKSDIMSLGIIEQDGKKVIHIGIDTDVFEERFPDIKEGLYDRFPGIEFDLASSAGVILDAAPYNGTLLDAVPVQ